MISSSGFGGGGGGGGDDGEIKPGATIPCTAPTASTIWHSQARAPNDRFEF